MIKWKPAVGNYATGNDAYLGAVKIGWAGYSSMGSKDDPKKYSCMFLLPGIKAGGRYEREEDARDWVERAASRWIDACGLAIKDTKGE